MRGPRDLVRRCCFLGVVWFLAGCADVSDSFDVGPFLGEQITGDSWRACLAREYQLQARFEVRNGRHWDTASTLAAKGRDALAGESVAPSSAPASQDFAPARARLDAMLANRERNPCDCAKAQARFDGWLAKQSRGADTTQVRTGFEEAANACAAPR